MKVFDFPVIKLTICLLIGIIIGSVYDISLQTSFITTGVLLVLLLVIYLISKNTFKKTIWFGLLSYTTMIFIGITNINLHNEENYSNHYTNFFEIKNSKTAIFQLKITEILKANQFNTRYYAEITSIDSTKVSGKILLNIKKDSVLQSFSIDSKILVKSKLLELYAPLNPYQFNYKKYLNNHDIYAQIYCEPNELIISSTDAFSIYGYANSLRQTIINRLEDYSFNTNELAIIKALLLGQRQDISNELRQQYINAGAVHILAISGLHVGIIYLILNFLLGFFSRFKYGNHLKWLVLVSLLWAYAIIAGLSPSVVRAVTMFSVIAIGSNLKRPYNIYNILAISAFFILLFKPKFLFEIGFQLSYLAVIGIVAIQPLLFNLVKTKYWLPNKVSSLLAVSIAAQIGVLPLSLYYFHQFPGLFFLTNLVVIPALGLILGLGFLVIILALMKCPNNFIFELYGSLISIMNQFFNWISLQEAFIFKDIPFTTLMVIGFYILIISLTKLFIKFNYKHILASLIAIIALQCIFIFTIYSTKNTDELVIFHKSRFTLIGEKQGNKLHLSHDLDSTTRNTDYILKNYVLGNFINTQTQDSLKNIYAYKNRALLVIDSLDIYTNLSFKPDYILLIKSPKLNLNRLIDSLRVKTIIADGSNYKSYVNRWKQTCLKRKIPFHYTGEKGAFIID